MGWWLTGWPVTNENKANLSPAGAGAENIRKVAGTAGMPAEPFLSKLRNQIIVELHK